MPFDGRNWSGRTLPRGRSLIPDAGMSPADASLLRRFGLKGASRFVPLLGNLLLAYDIFNFLREWETPFEGELPYGHLDLDDTLDLLDYPISRGAWYYTSGPCPQWPNPKLFLKSTETATGCISGQRVMWWDTFWANVGILHVIERSTYYRLTLGLVHRPDKTTDAVQTYAHLGVHGKIRVRVPKPDFEAVEPTNEARMRAFTARPRLKPVPTKLPKKIEKKVRLDPALQPVGKLMVDNVTPIPYRLLPKLVPNPYRYYQREVGYDVPDPRYIWVQPKTKPKQDEVEYIAPPVAISNKPIPAEALPKFHGYRDSTKFDAPTKTTRERKVSVITPVMAMITTAVNAGTEAIDLLESIYKALPTEYKVKWKDTPYVYRQAPATDKLRAIVDSWDKLDMVEVVYNIIAEQIEDRIYGEIGGANAQASIDLGLQSYAGINTLSNLVNRQNLYYRTRIAD